MLMYTIVLIPNICKVITIHPAGHIYYNRDECTDKFNKAKGARNLEHDTRLKLMSKLLFVYIRIQGRFLFY